MLRHVPLTAFAFALFGAAHARAGDGDELVYGATAQVEDEGSAPVDATAAQTERTLEPQESLPEALLRVPGVMLAQTGAMGSFTGLRLRGAELAHTEVFIGQVPLAGIDAGYDLGAYGGAAFTRLRVYRGGAPAALSSGAIGGVLQLESDPHGRRLWALGAAGSFRTGRIAVGADMDGPLRLHVALSLESTAADYPYLDDGGTAFEQDDDRTRRRANADQIRATGLVHGAYDTDAGTFSALVLVGSRQGGEPGAGRTRAEFARRRDTRIFGALTFTRETRALRTHIALGGEHQLRRFSDRFGEIGLGLEETRDQWHAAFLRSSFEVRLARVLEGTLTAGVRYDGFLPEDRIGFLQPDARRFTAHGGAELRLHGPLGPLQAELRASARIEGTTLRESGDVENRARSGSVQPTYRAGTRIGRGPFAFVASIARGRRLPTFLELFGDRGAIVRSPDLRIETGRSIDAGFVLDGLREREGRFFTGHLEARAFHLRIEDLIRFVPTSQFTAAARNLREGTLAGAELGASASLGGHALVEASGALMHTDDGNGRRLNWRPTFQGVFRAEGRSGELGPFADLRADVQLRVRSAYFNDAANFVRVPAMRWLDLGVSAELRAGVFLDLRLHDVLDQRGADFVGFPLPGRRFMATLRLERGI